jgi:hypothetical protein
MCHFCGLPMLCFGCGYYNIIRLACRQQLLCFAGLCTVLRPLSAGSCRSVIYDVFGFWFVGRSSHLNVAHA